MDVFFAGVDFALSAMNVYLALTKSGDNAFQWAVSVFCFGMGLIQIGIYLRNGGE